MNSSKSWKTHQLTEVFNATLQQPHHHSEMTGNQNTNVLVRPCPLLYRATIDRGKDCGADNEIQAKAAIRCLECGCRIMYKKRARRRESSRLCLSIRLTAFQWFVLPDYLSLVLSSLRAMQMQFDAR